MEIKKEVEKILENYTNDINNIDSNTWRKKNLNILNFKFFFVYLDVLITY